MTVNVFLKKKTKRAEQMIRIAWTCRRSLIRGGQTRDPSTRGKYFGLKSPMGIPG